MCPNGTISWCSSHGCIIVCVCVCVSVCACVCVHVSHPRPCPLWVHTTHLWATSHNDKTADLAALSLKHHGRARTHTHTHAHAHTHTHTHAETNTCCALCIGAATVNSPTQGLRGLHPNTTWIMKNIVWICVHKWLMSTPWFSFCFHFGGQMEKNAEEKQPLSRTLWSVCACVWLATGLSSLTSPVVSLISLGLRPSVLPEYYYTLQQCVLCSTYTLQPSLQTPPSDYNNN